MLSMLWLRGVAWLRFRGSYLKDELPADAKVADLHPPRFVHE